MKKFTLIEIFVVAMILVFGIKAYAGKIITFDKVHKYGGRIFFNPSQQVGGPINQTTGYYPFAIQLWGKSKSSTGERASASKTQVFGSPKNTTYTPKEIYQAAPAWLKPLMKDLWTELINEDLSE